MISISIDQLAFDAAVLGVIIGCAVLMVFLVACIIAAYNHRTSSGRTAAAVLLFWFVYCAVYGLGAIVYVIIRHMGL